MSQVTTPATSTSRKKENRLRPHCFNPAQAALALALHRAGKTEQARAVLSMSAPPGRQLSPAPAAAERPASAPLSPTPTAMAVATESQPSSDDLEAIRAGIQKEEEAAIAPTAQLHDRQLREDQRAGRSLNEAERDSAAEEAEAAADDERFMAEFLAEKALAEGAAAVAATGAAAGAGAGAGAGAEEEAGAGAEEEAAAAGAAPFAGAEDEEAAAGAEAAAVAPALARDAKRARSEHMLWASAKGSRHSPSEEVGSNPFT